MKKLHMGLLVIAAIIMSFIAVQNVSAETIEGTIDAITTRPNIVTVDGTDVYSVPINYLSRHYGIDLLVGDEVSFEVVEFECLSDPEPRHRYVSIN